MVGEFYLIYNLAQKTVSTSVVEFVKSEWALPFQEKGGGGGVLGKLRIYSFGAILAILIPV